MTQPLDRSPFSNSTDGHAWMSRWCENCAKDDDATDAYCPLLTVALCGSTPREWIPDQPLRLGYQYICTEFEQRAG